MNVLALRRWATLEDAERNRILARATRNIFDPKLLESIGQIYADVAARGDAAVADATERFDAAHPDERVDLDVRAHGRAAVPDRQLERPTRARIHVVDGELFLLLGHEDLRRDPGVVIVG